MAVSAEFELSSHKNPDNKVCTNDIKVVITYPVLNNTAKAYHSVFRIKGFNYEYTGVSGVSGNESRKSSKIKSITYYNPGGFGGKDSLKSMTIEIPGTDVYSIDIMICTVIQEVDYNAIVSTGVITTNSKLPANASSFAVLKDNGDILYVYRVSGFTSSLSEFATTSDFDSVPLYWSSPITNDTDEYKKSKNFIYFCKEEKSINCSIHSLNNKIIESIDNVSLCKESDCDCGNVKDEIKGYILTQYFYQYIQRHVKIITVDMNPNVIVDNNEYESLLQIDISNSDINNIRVLLNYYTYLIRCGEICSEC